MGRYRHFREQGITFVFKTDDDDPSLLHIFARHLTTVDDALDTFFDTGASQSWNAQHKRFERHSASHGLYWFWIDEIGKVAMVITCFTIEGGQP